MAEHYYSKAGNDSTGDGSPLNPYLTPEKALTEAYSSGGAESIIGGAGTYVGAELNASNEYLTLGANPPTYLTIKPEAGAEVVFISNSSTALVRHTSATGIGGTTVDIQDMILGRASAADPGVDANNLYWPHASAASNHTGKLTRCTLRNPLTYGVNSPVRCNVEMTDIVWEADRVNSRGLIFGTAWVDGSLTIDGVTATQTMHDVTSHGLINVDMAAAGVPVSIKNVTGTISINPSASGGGTVYGIRVVNADDAVIEGVTLTIGNSSAQTWVSYGVTMYGNDESLSALRQQMNDVILNLSTNGGFGASFGGDLADVVSNKADGSIMRRVRVNGSDTYISGNGHAIGLGDNDNCRCFGAIVSYCDIGLLDKVGQDNIFAGCLIYRCGGGSSNVATYAKGSTNSKFYNITVVIEDGYESRAFLAAVDGETNATGAEFKYSLVAVLSDTAQKIILVNASQTATFDYNHYYIVGGLPSNPFTYQSTHYAGASAWIAARETNGAELSENPFVSAETFDYTLTETSEARTSGAKWWGATMPPFGADGEPFPGWDISIGAIQSQTVPFHPTRL